MSKTSSPRSLGSRLAQRVSLGIVVGIVTLLAACGGGGGADTTASTSATTPVAATPAVPIPVTTTSCDVSVTDVSVSGFTAENARNVPVNPEFTATVTVTTGCGETAPKVSARLDVSNCPGSQSVDANVVMTSATKGTLTAKPASLGNGLTCAYTLTPSVNGKVGTTLLGNFTTEGVKVAEVVKAVYKADMFITLDGEIGQSDYVGGKFVDKLMTNGTRYASMADCTMVYIADEVLYKTDVGLPVARCFDQTNVQRDVEVDVVANKLGRTVVTPATVVTHSTGYSPSARFAAQGVSGLGRYSISKLNIGDVHYLTDAGALVHWVAPNGDFTKSYQVKNLTDGGTGYKGFVSVSN